MTDINRALESGRLSVVKRKLLEKYLSGELICEDRSAQDVIRRRPDGPAPLSLGQEQLWRREQIKRIPPLYNEAITIRHSGRLDISALERSLAEIVRRHEIWRTTYDTSNGSPIQIIHPAPGCFPLHRVDLRARDQPTVEAEIQRLITTETRRRFDLRQGPLLRATLFESDQEEYRLFLVAHLSIVDGISIYQVFPTEMASLYAAFSAGKPSPLPEPDIQYADYAVWQRWTFNAKERAKQLTYWREQLGDKPPILQWPAEHTRPVSQTYRGEICKFTLSTGLSGALKQFSRCQGVTLFTTLAASFGSLLHCYTRQVDLVIGTPSPAGRKRLETQSLLGYFLNPVALRIDLKGDPTFCELLSRVKNVVAGALCYDDVPLETISEELQIKPDTRRNPFFTVAISLQPKTPEAAAGWRVTSMDAESGGAPWDLYLAFIEDADGIIGRIQYNPDIFEFETITQMMTQLQLLMKAVTEDPTEPLSKTTRNLLSAA